VLGYIGTRSQKAEVQSVYGRSIYKPYIFTCTHLVELSGGSNAPYTQFMVLGTDSGFPNLILHGISFYLVVSLKFLKIQISVLASEFL
jgi:hypothetical protein